MTERDTCQVVGLLYGIGKWGSRSQLAAGPTGKGCWGLMPRCAEIEPEPLLEADRRKASRIEGKGAGTEGKEVP